MHSCVYSARMLEIKLTMPDYINIMLFRLPALQHIENKKCKTTRLRNRTFEFTVCNEACLLTVLHENVAPNEKGLSKCNKITQQCAKCSWEAGVRRRLIVIHCHWCHVTTLQMHGAQRFPWLTNNRDVSSVPLDKSKCPSM